MTLVNATGPAIATHADTNGKANNKPSPRIERVYTGKLDVYKQTTIITEMSHGPNGTHNFSSSKHYNYFVAPPLSKTMVPLNYDSIKKLIPVTDPAYSYVKKYQRQRSAQRITTWTGIGLGVTGLIVSSLAEKKGNRPLEVANYGILTVGLGTTIYSLTVLDNKKERTIRMAVGKYNGVDYDELEAKKKAEKSR